MWQYQDKEFKTTDIPDNAIGFIYEMTAIVDGKPARYIGKKDFYANVKKYMGKKELAALTDKRVKKYTRIKKFAYENYFSSNLVLKDAHKAGIPITRRIIYICFSKTELTYMECKYQFAFEVLESDEFLNGNILGRFYKIK